MDDKQLASLRTLSVNALHWRYIPKVGGTGADLSQPVLFTQRVETECGWQGSGGVQWTALRYEQNPIQAHIIYGFASWTFYEFFWIKIAYLTMLGKILVSFSLRRFSQPDIGGPC